MADFNQAIQWLKEGKKVRRKYWGNKELRGYMVDRNHIYFQDKQGAVSAEFLNVIDNLEATDWEVYCEEIILEKKSFAESVSYLKAKFDVGEINEDMYKIQIAALVENIK